MVTNRRQGAKLQGRESSLIPTSYFLFVSMTQRKLTGTLTFLTLVLLTLLFFYKILLTNLILVGVDTFLYFYPYKAYVAEALQQGRLPLWNPHLFMGAPLLANSQVGLFYPFNWLFIWLDAPKQVAWSIGLHVALAGLLMLAFARQSLGLSWAGAMVAAILFAFGGYLGAQVEHINQLNAAAWLPLLFLLYDFGRQRRRRRHWFWFFLLALVIALTLLAGHAQTVFISLFGLGLYALWQGVSEWANRRIDPSAANTTTSKDRPEAGNDESTPGIPHPSRLTPHPLHNSQFTIRNSPHASRLTSHALRATLTRLLTRLGPLAAAVVLAMALAAVQLLPTAELSALSIRGGGLTFREVVAFSLRPSLLPYTLLPPLGLDLSQVLGEAFGEGVAYVGVTGLVLALLGGLRSIWHRPARRFVFVAAGGLILSLGLYTGPLYLVLYYLVPGFDLFRVPARWLLLYAFGVAVLAGFGFDALLTPSTLPHQLASARFWLRARRWRMVLFIGLPLIALLGLILWKTPPLLTLIAWLILAIVAVGLIYYASRPPVLSEAEGTPHPPPSPQSLVPNLHAKRPISTRSVQSPIRHSPFALRPTLALSTLLLLLLVELLWASQGLNYNQPTAPQAYHSIRNAVAFLLAVDPPAGKSAPPDRFLSLSGITYDPGDLTELEQIYGHDLSPKALYNLTVAAKEKEVLFYNLPLLYGLHSVDGYDGGILPLARFVTLQKLFLPPDDLSLDGRLREKLRFVPPSRLLSLLNTRWIITDKVFDVWIDDVFYDLQFPAHLAPGRSVAAADIPAFPATAIGLVSHLQGATGLPADAPVAGLTLTFTGGASETFVLKAGVDTAEGSYSSDVAHPQATVGVTWPYQEQGVDYITVFPLASRQPITRISLTALLPTGRFVLRGLSLINRPTTTGRSVILTTEGDYRQVHSGDVKIYENRAVLPRAFVVHRAELVSSDEQAIALMRDPDFDPAEKLVRLAHSDEPPGLITAGQPSPADVAAIVAYEPERVQIDATLHSPGWLVLTDADYPGWQATVDGRPAEILQANIMFRAVALPPGRHTVVFEFRPRSLRTGAWITAVASVLVLAGLAITARPR